MKLNPSSLRKMAWRCFAFMWIPFITLFIGMWGMPEGSYSFAELPELAQYSIVALAIFFALTFIFFFGTVITSQATTPQLLKYCKKAPAKIIDIYETGTTVNNSYMVGFKLEVMPRHAPKFTATTEQLISRLQVHKFEVGKKVLVNYDPKTHNTVIVGELKETTVP